MKKNLIILLALFSVVLFCGQAFAAALQNEGDSAGDSLEVGGGALVLNYSPKVAGQYITEGTTTNEQWFAIGTYHGGGQSFYATSSQQTAIYKKDRTQLQTFTDAAIPTTQALSESESQWTDASWTK